MSKIGPAMRQQASKQLHYKFCPSPRADALQVLAPSERAWAVQRSRCRAFLVFDASVPDA